MKLIDYIPNFGFGIIAGDIGTGKSVTGYYIAELISAVRNKSIYIVGAPEPLKRLLPPKFNFCDDIHKLPKNCIILSDESYLLFYSREFYKDPNKFIDKLSGIVRHRKILAIFISQQLRKLDISIVASARFLIFKKPSLLQSKFERKELRALIENIIQKFKNVKNHLKSCYIITSDFEGMLEDVIELPSWWNEEISTSFENVLGNDDKTERTEVTIIKKGEDYAIITDDGRIFTNAEK